MIKTEAEPFADESTATQSIKSQLLENRTQRTSQRLKPEQVVQAQAQVSFPRSHLRGSFWLKHDPEKNPLTQLLISQNGTITSLLPNDMGVRSKVHEYGGVPYTVTDSGIYWVDEDSQQLLFAPWLQDSQLQTSGLQISQLQGSKQQSLNVEIPTTQLDISQLQQISDRNQCRYGEPVRHPNQPYLVAIEEEHPANHPAKAHQVINRLVAFNLIDQQRYVLAEGADFYSSPCFDQTGQQIAWIEWSHPDQPWTSTRLKQAQWPEASLCHQLRQFQQQAGQSEKTIHKSSDDSSATALNSQQIFPRFKTHIASVQQPSFDSQGQLLFISDHQGYWNLYSSDKTQHICCLYEIQADCASAPWQFGNQHYQYRILDDNSQWLSICVSQNGRWQLHHLTALAGEPLARCDKQVLNRFDDYCHFSQLSLIPSQDSNEQKLLVQVASEQQALSIIEVSFNPKNATESALFQYLDNGYCIADAVTPEAVQLKLPAHDIHGLFYPNPDTSAAPLLINVHGGPTSCAFPGLQLHIQFWLQQGFSVLDLNHRGSTGYGRNYREALFRQWGEADLEDARLMAHWLEKQACIDGNKVVIRGQSAGGYSALRAATLGYFTAAVSLYGISDLQRLAKSTHKFESHYLHWLIGDPNRDSMTYQLRSPLFSLSKQTQLPALMLFQGAKDRVVPADQMKHFAKHYQSLGHHCESFIYDDEAHGFRQFANRLHQLKTELAFYQSQGILSDV